MADGAERVTPDPSQNVSGPLAEIVGIPGAAFTKTVIATRGLSSPAEFF